MRARTRTRMFARIYWREIDRTDIDLNPDKYEWEMTIRYEDMIISWFFTKWRLDDVTMNLSHWKVMQF